MEEFYEELPGEQIQDYPEDLYEDLPANDLNYPDPNQPPYSPNAFSSGISPPPLPTGPIPTHRPGGPPPPSQAAPPPPVQSAPPPPLPTRAPTTSLSAPAPPPIGSTRTLQPQGKKNKPEAKKKGATIARSGGSGSSGGGGGGGGLDMSEILKKARQRSEKAIENLEKQRAHRDEPDAEDKPAAPWLNQLRKPSPIHPKPKPIKETPAVNGTKEEDNVPEFIRKARTFSVSQEDETNIKPVSPIAARKPPPVTAKPPPAPAKPRLPMPSMPVDSSGSNQSTESQENKPAWLKQRERQVKMASETAAKPPPGPKPPAGLPNGSPAHTITPSSSAPPPAKKPRPVPAPRGVTSPKKEPYQPAVANEPAKQGSPPTVTHVGSVMDRARTLERGMSGSVSPPPSPKGLSPKPTPPTRTTPTHHVGSIGDRSPITTVASPGIPSKPPVAGKPGPPPPMRREFKEPAPPPAASPSPTPPPIPTKGPPPPPATPPPPSVPPPLPTGPPPTKPPSFPPVAPATHGESTPRTDLVHQFRRLPLQFVDLSNPPPMPSRSSKLSSPIATGEGTICVHCMAYNVFQY